MLRAFFDETASHHDPKMIGVAGTLFDDAGTDAVTQGWDDIVPIFQADFQLDIQHFEANATFGVIEPSRVAGHWQNARSGQSL